MIKYNDVGMIEPMSRINRNKAFLSLSLFALVLAGLLQPLTAWSKDWQDPNEYERSRQNTQAPHSGKITGKSVAAGALSLLVWPGIGQAINDNAGKKVGTHAVLGLLPPYRIWSGYDALVDRKGGYWKGKI
jgi:hypothetical protein